MLANMKTSIITIYLLLAASAPTILAAPLSHGQQSAEVEARLNTGIIKDTVELDLNDTHALELAARLPTPFGFGPGTSHAATSAGSVAERSPAPFSIGSIVKSTKSDRGVASGIVSSGVDVGTHERSVGK